jgi:hypothetical protein
MKALESHNKESLRMGGMGTTMPKEQARGAGT